jgi:hypothetical protein
MAERTNPDGPRSLARAAAAIAAAVIVCGALLLLATYLLHKEKPFAGTPSPRALFSATVFTVPAHQSACMSSVTLAPNGRILQFELREPAGSTHASPPIDALLSAPGYRELAHLPGEEPEGAVTLRVHPPRHYVIGSACLINRGSTPVGLAGSTEARSRSRVKLTLAGRPVAGDVALTFLSNRSQSRLSRLGEVFSHASNLTDRLIPVWLMWIVAIAVLLAVPTATVLMFYRALEEDELETPS